MKPYDEKEHWSNRKWPNANLTKKQIVTDIYKYIIPHLTLGDTLLDFGPGVGRLFPLFSRFKEVVAYDITDKWKSVLYKEADKYKLSNFKFILGGQKKLPFEDSLFDVSVSMSVFMHQRPENIVNTMTELARVSKKVVVGTSFYPKLPFDTIALGSTKQGYNHNYWNIIETNNLNLLYVNKKAMKLLPGFVYFCYSKRGN